MGKVLIYAAVIFIFVSSIFIWHDLQTKLIGLGIGFILLGLNEIAKQLEKIAKLQLGDQQVLDDQPNTDKIKD